MSVPSGPRSRECGQYYDHETCQGFAGDYDTYHCARSCHWCKCGLFHSPLLPNTHTCPEPAGHALT